MLNQPAPGKNTMDTATALNQQSDEAFAQALNEALESDDRNHRPPAVRDPVKPEIMTVSHVHEAIMNFMIQFPERPLRDCAAHFGYTQAWLSTIIHSDVFQARLREKQDEVFSGVKDDLGTKLAALADVGIEKLQQKMETSEDPKFILEATKTALSTLGFGAPGRAPANNVNAQNVQQNFYVASPADLSAARERMRVVGQVSTSAPESAPGDAPGTKLLGGTPAPMEGSACDKPQVLGE